MSSEGGFQDSPVSFTSWSKIRSNEMWAQDNCHSLLAEKVLKAFYFAWQYFVSSPCYNLISNVFQRPICLAWKTYGTTGRWWKLKEVEFLVEEFQFHEGDIRNTTPSSSCLWLSSMRWAVFHHTFCHNILDHLGPKVMKPIDHGVKPTELWTKINLSSF
jgi:hypothetical protein